MGWESICAMTALQLRAELAAGHLSAREILQLPCASPRR